MQLRIKVTAWLGILALAAIAAGAGDAAAADISGAGATFPYPIYAKWAEAYKAKTGIRMNYQSIGSGGGIKQITASTVDFGASDMPLKPEDLDKAGLTQWPMIMGGVVVAVNLPGVKPGELTLDGAILADIYLGKITKWDDAAIRKLNPSTNLPDSAIAPLYRSDGSGTNFIFTDYLSKVSAEFKSKVGENTSVEWPVGVGGKGNEGVAALAARIPGAIGYVEYAYAVQNNLAFTKLINQEGNRVAPDAKSFQAAAVSADWRNAPGFYLLLTDQPGKQSWPITGASFILMQRTQQRPEIARRVLEFFHWAYKNGGELAERLDYVPIPDAVVSLVEASWTANIKDKDGKPIWPPH